MREHQGQLNYEGNRKEPYSLSRFRHLADDRGIPRTLGVEQ